MPDERVRAHIECRLLHAGLPAPRDLLIGLSTYLDTLARWNARMNLTAYALDQPSDEAIDRLIVEPVAMARVVRPGDRRALDVGSGGGSPALPFRLAAPRLTQVLVESRQRKAAFLREAIRTIGLKGVTVENRRLEELTSDEFRHQFDLVTMRAVRPDDAICRGVRSLLNPGGRFLWLTSAKIAGSALQGFSVQSEDSLLPESTTILVSMISD